MKKWKVYYTLSVDTTFPIEDGEDREKFTEWLKTKEGQEYLIEDAHKLLKKAEINVDEVGDIDV